MEQMRKQLLSVPPDVTVRAGLANCGFDLEEVADLCRVDPRVVGHCCAGEVDRQIHLGEVAHLRVSCQGASRAWGEVVGHRSIRDERVGHRRFHPTIAIVPPRQQFHPHR